MKKAILILIILIGVQLSSCKKKGTTPNNPDVTNRIIDSSLSVNTSSSTESSSIDANNDGTIDFYLNGSYFRGEFSTSLNTFQTSTDVAFTTDGFSSVADFDNNALIDSSLSVPKGPRPNAIWNLAGICSRIGNGINEGYSGKGDFFVGFYFSLLDGKHYGWLKLNVAIDGKTITLKELAYQEKPRTAIKVGEI
jgi:hypothetical protein